MNPYDQIFTESERDTQNAIRRAKEMNRMLFGASPEFVDSPDLSLGRTVEPEATP